MISILTGLNSAHKSAIQQLTSKMEEKEGEISKLKGEIEEAKKVSKKLDQDNTKLIYESFINEMRVLRQGNKNSKLARFKSQDYEYALL